MTTAVHANSRSLHETASIFLDTATPIIQVALATYVLGLFVVLKVVESLCAVAACWAGVR
jgi:hypothetical protein